MDFPPENIKDRVADFLTSEKMRDNFVIKILIGIVLLVVAVFFFPHPEMIEYNYSIGTIWADKDLIASFDFPVYKDLRQYEHERQEAIRSVYTVFERHDEVSKTTDDSIKSIIRILDYASATKARWLKSMNEDDSIEYIHSIRRIPFELTASEEKLLLKYIGKPIRNDNPFIQLLNRSIQKLIGDIQRVGIMDQVKSKQLHTSVALRKGSVEEIVPSEKFYDQEDAGILLSSRIESIFKDNIEAGLAFKIVRTGLLPNILYDQQATNQAVQIAADNVPRTIGFVRENEHIIRKHESITEEIKLKLDSFRRVKAEQVTGLSGWKHWVGTSFHVLIILGLFTLYLSIFRKRIFHDNGKLMIIAVLIVMEMFFAYLSLLLNFQIPLQYLVLVPTASMLLVIIYDSRVAFYGTVIIAFLIAGMRGNDYTIVLSSIVAGALGAYSVRDIRSRTQIFRSLVFIFLGYLLSIFALSLEQLETFSAISTEITFAFANAVFSSVLAYGLLIVFEKGFKVATDLTLAELSDFNHPLLIELSEKAPGTFHHSVTIGNLAEAAAEAIGANAILARVGGYYHDVGKILKPEYFMENQVGPHSRHARLKPRMSALIISSHVREGIELGRERGLPEKVIDFIPQHHGTTRISFFYDKALRHAARKPSKDVLQEEDFMYPGPKPQTKETGIVMLADSVEAITRSLTDITPQKLEAAIDNMIKHRFMEGQLDECELTLRDLTKIREAFLKILMGTYHHRIKYPEQQAESTEATPAQQEQPEQPLPSTTQPDAELSVENKPQVAELQTHTNSLSSVQQKIDQPLKNIPQPPSDNQ